MPIASAAGRRGRAEGQQAPARGVRLFLGLVPLSPARCDCGAPRRRVRGTQAQHRLGNGPPVDAEAIPLWDASRLRRKILHRASPPYPIFRRSRYQPVRDTRCRGGAPVARRSGWCAAVARKLPPPPPFAWQYTGAGGTIATRLYCVNGASPTGGAYPKRAPRGRGTRRGAPGCSTARADRIAIG